MGEHLTSELRPLVFGQRRRSAVLPPRSSLLRFRGADLCAGSSERPVWPAELRFRAGGQRRRSLALRNRSADERLCSPELRVGRAEDQSRRAESGRDIARHQNKTARRRVAAAGGEAGSGFSRCGSAFCLGQRGFGVVIGAAGGGGFLVQLPQLLGHGLEAGRLFRGGRDITIHVRSALQRLHAHVHVGVVQLGSHLGCQRVEVGQHGEKDHGKLKAGRVKARGQNRGVVCGYLRGSYHERNPLRPNLAQRLALGVGEREQEGQFLLHQGEGILDGLGIGR